MNSKLSPLNKNIRTNLGSIIISLLLIIGLGFTLRYIYLNRMILHVDEFLSLLGIKMILQEGIPVLPTGLFHGKGLVYNYLGAGVATIFGFEVETIRYLTLGLSILTIPLVYWVASKLFENDWAALWAALVFAILPTAILWGGRARMYALAEMMVYLIIVVGWLGVVGPRRYLWSILLPVVTLAMLFSHLVTIVIVPALLLAYIIIDWLINKPNFKQLNTWTRLIGLGIGLLLAASLGYWLGREPGEMRQWQQEASILGNISRALFDLRLLRNFYLFFLIPENVILTLLAFVGVIGLGLKTYRRTLTKPDWAALFIYLQISTIFILLYVVIPSNIRDERHNFILLLPYLILAAAYGITILTEFLQAFIVYRGKSISLTRLAAGTVLAISLILFVQQWSGINQLLFAEESRTYRYDQALTLVDDYLAPEDQLLSVMPPAAYLYYGPLDYYANQHKPRFIENKAGQKVDYYTGGIYLDNVDEFYQAIDQPGRLWFVVDEKRLTVNYDAKFSQEIIHQMALVDRVGDVLIFVERDEPWPMAETPEIQIEADFSDQMKLVGYTTQLDGPELKLTLFWQPGTPIFNYKIFVQLRDQTGQTVAQADFLPYDNIIQMSQWRIEWQEDVIPTGTALHLPPEILQTDPSQYRLYVGLYLPELNSERVPVVSDISGENAVILTDLGL